MANASYEFVELRFIYEEELTQVYAMIRAIGDCPIGVQGWHHKTFHKSKSAVDILKEDIAESVLWPLAAPR